MPINLVLSLIFGCLVGLFTWEGSGYNPYLGLAGGMVSLVIMALFLVMEDLLLKIIKQLPEKESKEKEKKDNPI